MLRKKDALLFQNWGIIMSPCGLCDQRAVEAAWNRLRAFVSGPLSQACRKCLAAVHGCPWLWNGMDWGRCEKYANTCVWQQVHLPGPTCDVSSDLVTKVSVSFCETALHYHHNIYCVSKRATKPQLCQWIGKLKDMASLSVFAVQYLRLTLLWLLMRGDMDIPDYEVITESWVGHHCVSMVNRSRSSEPKLDFMTPWQHYFYVAVVWVEVGTAVVMAGVWSRVLLGRSEMQGWRMGGCCVQNCFVLGLTIKQQMVCEPMWPPAPASTIRERTTSISWSFLCSGNLQIWVITPRIAIWDRFIGVHVRPGVPRFMLWSL